LLVIVKLDEHY